MRINDDCFYWVGHSIRLDVLLGWTKSLGFLVTSSTMWQPNTLSREKPKEEFSFLPYLFIAYLFIDLLVHINLDAWKLILFYD